MTLYFLSFWACTESSTPQSIYYTELPEDTGSTTDSGGTTETDTSDTDDSDAESQTIEFKTENISCENLVYYELSFTQLVPGGLELAADADDDVTNDLLAEFEYEIWRYGFEDFQEIRKDNANSDDGCYFQISLPSAAPGNLKNIVTDDDEEENNAADAPKWSFYYITMISKEKISCSDPSLSSHTCSLIPQQPTTQISAADLDPQLEDGDFHVWSSTTLLSYTQGVLSPSLQDMGFQNKWNLTSFEQATINTVEALSTDSEATYELMPIEIELDDLVPRYNVSASVENNWTDPSCSDSSDGTCPKNQLGLRPLSWIVEDPLVSELTQNPHRRIYYNGLHSSTLTENLELYVWGIPDEDHFENFPAVDSTSTYYTSFQQWGSFPDVSVEALMVFETTYNSETETEVWFDESSEQRGALCRDSERVVFVYYDSADRPSEALWYQLSGIKPGWKVSYGTQGQIDTWRFMVEATTGVLTYNNLEVSSTCTIPSDWN